MSDLFKLHSARVDTIRDASEVVKALVLEVADGGFEVDFEPGAHIDLHLPNDMVRSYSLVASRGKQCEIAVARDVNSRGGSLFIHDTLRVGDLLQVSEPRNNFPLAPPSEAPSIFIAGGIGITPIYAMIKDLQTRQMAWTLYYYGRSRSLLAFTNELVTLSSHGSGTVNISCDDERGGGVPDLQAVIANAPTNAHLYCCGPTGMLSAFSSLTEQWPRAQIHLEYFSPPEGPDTSGGFEVVLARSNRVVHVPPGKTILDALLDENVDVPCSCMEGHCGSCETRVVEGIPDHRDVFLSEEEKARNDRMMICVSGCHGSKLVLDI